ncbi:UNVERIFIED_CONTAM: hypothetical protein Slati_3147800 [Sesamum latifolium]|uniref:GRF-type domain-containing protein n=1 Tax=Sesamum latifolium TaxID=2727402 RepID=A0AAW2UVP9_9LAMI
MTATFSFLISANEAEGEERKLKMSSILSGNNSTVVNCFCGIRAPLRTSWTNDNPGRRFYSCPNCKSGGCRFFTWDDPPMCVIPDLRRKLQAMETEANMLKKKIFWLKVCLVATWFVLVGFWIGKWMVVAG